GNRRLVLRNRPNHRADIGVEVSDFVPHAVKLEPHRHRILSFGPNLVPKRARIAKQRRSLGEINAGAGYQRDHEKFLHHAPLSNGKRITLRSYSSEKGRDLENAECRGTREWTFGERGA